MPFPEALELGLPAKPALFDLFFQHPLLPQAFTSREISSLQ
jgi:hypothetical protein